MNLDLNSIPLDNNKTWSLIQRGHTGGVFQLESELGKQWVSRIQPKNLTELSAVLALIRPACLESGMTEHYCKIKNKKEPPLRFNDIEIDRILGPTDGVLIYQEQLMKFGGEVAWKHMPKIERLVMVDKLRKGIGKKDVRLLSELKAKFIEGCVLNGRTEELALRLFSMIESAGRYAFNDAHAKKYALISYRTAYLKANHPYIFYTVYLTYSKSKQKPKEEIRDLINEARMLGMSILPPDVKSGNEEFITEGKDILYGLSHIKQVSKSDVSVISNNKSVVSSFLGLLVLHFDKEGLNKRVRSLAVENLIKSGSCDSYDISRRVMLEIFNIIKGLTPKEIGFVCGLIKNTGATTLLEIIKIIKKCGEECSVKKRVDLVISEAESIDITEVDKDSWKVSMERDILGIEFTKIFKDDKVKHSTTCKECFKLSKNNKGKKGDLAVDISEVINLVTKKGKNPGSEMCQLVVSDNSGSLKLACFPDKYSKYKTVFMEGERYSISIIGTGSGWCLNEINLLKQ